MLVRHAIARAVESADLQVVEAGDAQSAISVAKAIRFDSAIVDVNMPGMDGIGLIRTLRCMEGYSDLPVFVLTTNASPGLIEQGRALGLAAWIPKPFSPESLRSGVRVVLSQRPSAA